MKKASKKLKDKELNVINFYGILSFVSMIIFIGFAMLNRHYQADTFAFNFINVVSAIGFVVSVVYAIYSLCSTLKVREYGAVLAMITLMIISGTIVALYYVSTIEEDNKYSITDVDQALKCAGASKCSINDNGDYTCTIKDGTELICPNKWHNYYSK